MTTEVMNRLNAKAAVINIANILSSRDSRVRQSALILFLNPALQRPYGDDEAGGKVRNTQPTEIRVTLDGNILIDGKKIDSKNPPPGYRIFVDRKEARS